MNDRTKVYDTYCPHCKRPFSLKSDVLYTSSQKLNASTSKLSRDSHRPKFWREPHLMPCGHLICSVCISSKEKEKCGFVKCPTCQSEHPITSDRENLNRFPFSTYHLGILCQNRIPRRAPDVLSQQFVSLAELNKTKDTSKNCQMCLKVPAPWTCEPCKLKTCEECFTQLHTGLEEDHERIPTNPLTAYKISKCEYHHHASDFVCKDCDEKCCPHCFFEDHKNHVPYSVLAENKKVVDQITGSIQQLKTVEGILQKSIKQLKYQSYSSENKKNCAVVVNSIRNKFSELHGHLQLRELEMIREVEEANAKLTGSLQEIRNAEENLEQITQIISDFQQSAEAPEVAEFDYTEMLKQIQTNLKVPCQLQTAAQSAGIKPGEKLRCKIDVDGIKKIIQEIGEFFIADKDNDQKLLIPYEIGLSDDTDDESSSIASSHSSCRKSRQSPLTETKKTISEVLSCHAVQSSFVISPGHFYVHMTSSVDKLTELQTNLNKIGNSNKAERYTSFPGNNQTCLVRNPKDNKWYRGRVLPSTSEFLRSVEPWDSTTDVPIYYLDYGNWSFVSLADICVLPAQMRAVGALAMKCSLHDIVPCTPDGWDASATMFFENILQNASYLHLHVYESLSDTKYVDITCGGNDHPHSSVREILCFFRLASLQTNHSQPIQSSMKHYVFDRFFEPSLPSLGKPVAVEISNVDDPNNFYVQEVAGNVQYLEEMQGELQQVYGALAKENIQNIPDKMTIYTPIIGLPCVAQYDGDGKWYRCRIESEMDANRLLEIFYVDYGNKARVRWNDLKTIRKHFLRYSCFGLKCSLADVVPAKGRESWSEEAIEFFKAKTILMDGNFEITILDTIKSGTETTLSVKLTCLANNGVNECINSALVIEKLAASTGLSSTPDALVNNVELKKKPSKLTQSNVTTLQASILERYDQVAPQNALMAALSRPQSNADVESVDYTTDEETQLEFLPLATSEQNNSVDLTTMTDDIEYEEADGKISYSESPSVIYFQPFKTRQVELDKLMLELKKKYQSSQHDVNAEWEENQRCVAYEKVKKEWYRVEIIKVMEESKSAEVRCIDYGYRFSCEFIYLRKLTNQFYQNPFVLLCHLSVVKAAGDKSNWTTMACECLNDLIAEYDEFIMTRLGASENGSLPVELYYKSTIPGGALTPEKVTKKSVSNYLIEKGMALPIQNSRMTVLETVKEIVSSESVEANTLGGLSSSKSDEEFVDSRCSDVDIVVTSSNEQIEIAENTAQGLIIEEIESSEFLLGAKYMSSDDELFSNCVEQKMEFENVEEEDDNYVLVDSKDSQTYELDSYRLPRVDDVSDSRIDITGKFTWKKPIPLKSREFFCKVTYIHKDGTIYLKNKEMDTETNWIFGGLQAKYNNSSWSDEDMYWFEGDICVVQVNNVWYRATVIQNNSETNNYLVQLLDYGKYETVNYECLRKEVICKDEPQLCYKCVLADINLENDDGYWPDHILRYFNEVLIENADTFKWKVMLTEWPIINRKNSTLAINLFSGDRQLREMLVACDLINEDDMQLSSSTLVYQESSENDLLDAIEVTQLPELGKKISVCITDVQLNPLMISFHIKAPFDPNSPETEVINEELKQLEEMNTFLLANYDKLEPVETLKPADVVCCLHSNDSAWYRGRIQSVNANDDLTVLFIDYGNMEVTTRDNLRKLPNEYRQLPIQAISCQLHQVRIRQDKNYKKSSEILYNLLAKLSQQRIFAEVKDLTEPIKVDLLLYENGQFSLAYQELIDDETVYLVREKSTN